MLVESSLPAAGSLIWSLLLRALFGLFNFTYFNFGLCPLIALLGLLAIAGSSTITPFAIWALAFDFHFLILGLELVLASPLIDSSISEI